MHLGFELVERFFEVLVEEVFEREPALEYGLVEGDGEAFVVGGEAGGFNFFGRHVGKSISLSR